MALGAQYDAHARGPSAAGRAWTETGSGLYDTYGSVARPVDASKQFAGFCEMARVRYRRLYVLRHTVATLLLASGTPMGIVQEVLGHSSIVLTADTHSHVTAGLRVDAAESIQRAFQADG
jgi:integrase